MTCRGVTMCCCCKWTPCFGAPTDSPSPQSNRLARSHRPRFASKAPNRLLGEHSPPGARDLYFAIGLNPSLLLNRTCAKRYLRPNPGMAFWGSAGCVETTLGQVEVWLGQVGVWLDTPPPEVRTQLAPGRRRPIQLSVAPWR